MQTSTVLNNYIMDLFNGNQTRAAEALGVTRSTISRILKGSRKISPKLAQKMEELSDGRFK